MRSYRDGSELARQQMRGYVEKEYGAPYLHIHRGDFHAVLVEKARELGVESMFPLPLVVFLLGSSFYMGGEYPGSMLYYRFGFGGAYVVGSAGRSVGQSASLYHGSLPANTMPIVQSASPSTFKPFFFVSIHIHTR